MFFSQFILFSLGVKRKVHLRSSLLSSLFSEACHIKGKQTFQIFTNVSVFFFFFPVAFPVWQAILSAHRLLDSLYLLSPVTCFVTTATCHNPPQCADFSFFSDCHLCTVPQCTAVYPQQVLLHEQTENCERREDSYADHILVWRLKSS